MFTTLIDVATLAAHLNDPSWAVLDCRFDLADKSAGRRAYASGHLPGAVYADLEQDLSGPVTAQSGRHPLPELKPLVQRLGEWGIDARTQVVVYDASGGGIAARGWWLLRWLGHEAVALLDGGLPAWERAGYPLTAAVRTSRPRAFTERRCEGAVSVDELQQDRDSLLVDARSAGRYRGEEEPIDPVAGHIPGAINAPFEANLDGEGRFLPVADLKERFAALLGDRDPASVIHYCGSGVTACHNLLAMEHVGFRGSRLYVGSWSEWISDPSRKRAAGRSPRPGVGSAQ